jgi:hypothetical protein
VSHTKTTGKPSWYSAHVGVMLRFRWNRIDWARSLPDSSHLKRAELGGFSELINLSAGF